MNDVKSKIRKLFAQADGESRLGNTQAASAFRKKANELLKANKLTKKQLSEPEKVNIVGTWICSCGAEISLDFFGLNPSLAGLAKSILAPHQRDGHILTQRV